MRMTAPLLLACAVLSGCDEPSTNGGDRTAKSRATATKKGPTGGGLKLKKVKGAPVAVTELTARPTLSVLADVDGVRFPGETQEGDNTIEIRFAVTRKKKVAAGAALVVRHTCQHGEHVLVREREVKLRLAGKSKRVGLHGLDKGQRGIGSSIAAPTAPELGKASACEARFFVKEGDDERHSLGTVCATGGTKLKRKPCSDAELKRPQTVGAGPVMISEPVGRVAHQGAAGWYVATATRRLKDEEKLWTKLDCHEGTNKALKLVYHQSVLAPLTKGESAMLTFGNANLKWLTREGGACDVTIGLDDGGSRTLATYCLKGGRTAEGACE
jgi:hypothetical protein